MGQLPGRALVDVLRAGDKGDPGALESERDHQVVEPIAGQPIDLVDDQVLHRLGLDELQYPLELGSVGRAGALARVDELLDHDSAERLSFSLGRRTLGWDRVALGLSAPLCLLLRGNAKVEDGPHTVELKELNPTRATDKTVTSDRLGPFLKSVAYEGWKRSIYPVDWFDSEPERRVANMVDDDDGVSSWVRLQLKDLPILWTSGGQEYNPDLIVIDKDGTHWVVEVKMDKEMESEDVKGKRDAAKRWTNHVTADPQVGVIWRYLLVSETDIKTAKNSWPALRKLGDR